MPRPGTLGEAVGRGTPCVLDASVRRNQHGDRGRDRLAGAGGEALPVRKPSPCEQREAANRLLPCVLRGDCGRVRSQPLARGHGANRAGLSAGRAVAPAPGANGAMVPAEPRLSPVPRGAPSCGAPRWPSPEPTWRSSVQCCRNGRARFGYYDPELALCRRITL